MKFNKTWAIIIILVILIVLLAAVQLISRSISTKQQTPPPIPILQIDGASPKPTAQTSRTVYDTDDLSKDFQRIKNKTPLSNPDSAIRQKLIEGLGNKSGILIQTDAYMIEYVKAPNQFMAQILGRDIGSAKSLINDWFLQQGLSQNGICNLPLVLYLGPDPIDQLRKTGEKFNPIPKGCE